MITTSATTLQRQGLKEIAGTYLGIASAWEAQAGQCAEAQALSGAAVAASRGLVPMVTRAAALAECGKTREAEAVLSELDARGLTRSYPEALAAGSCRAMIALQQGDTATAVSITEGNAAYEDVEGPGITAMYVRARAHLAAGDPTRATAAFQKCATTPAGDVASPARAYCLVGLARARSAAGDADGSRKAYEEFLTLWKDADPEVPILKAAKAEYAKVKR